MKSDSSTSEVQLSDSSWRLNTSPSSDSENGSEPVLNLGKLEFSVNYDTEKETLQVTLLAAYDLREDKDTTYIEVYLLPDKTEKRQSSIHYSESNPVYNESFEFLVGYSELSERTLQFSLFHVDSFSRHHALGEVFYSFDVNDNIDEDKAVTICKDIKRDVFLATVSGFVRFVVMSCALLDLK